MYGWPFARYVAPDRNVTIGLASSPVTPVIVMTALPCDPTLYEPGLGEIVATMCRFGRTASSGSVFTVTVAVLAPAGSRSTGLGLW